VGLKGAGCMASELSTKKGLRRSNGVWIGIIGLITFSVSDILFGAEYGFISNPSPPGLLADTDNMSSSVQLLFYSVLLIGVILVLAGGAMLLNSKIKASSTFDPNKQYFSSPQTSRQVFPSQVKETSLSYSQQEELIADKVKQSIEHLIPEGGVECKLIYCMPLENLGKKELENLKGKLKDSDDKKSLISKTCVIIIPLLINSFMYTPVEITMIEIIHIGNDLWITSSRFTYDDMAIYIGHQLKDYFNLTVGLCNPEKTFA
jgi:hypothetical protein